MDQMSILDQSIASYRMSDASVDIIQTTPIVLLVGITAAGKDTIQNKLLENDEYHKIVTHTTRAPRTNSGLLEQDGDNYHFISVDQMRDMLAEQKLIEVNRFGDNYYGTSIGEFAAAKYKGKIALGDIDVNGIDAFRAISEKNIIPIFIVPPDYATWRARLDGRYHSKDELERELPKRFAAAERELEYALSKPYYHFIINDDLDRAVRVAHEIAHGGNVFNRHDQEARTKAAELLSAIRQNS
jgi:guanylate kinase